MLKRGIFMRIEYFGKYYSLVGKIKISPALTLFGKV